MNKVHRTLLNVMRIEVLLSLGLVMWVMSIEARAEAQCPFSGQEIDALRDNAISKNKFSLVRALNSCGADNAKPSDQALLDNALEILNISAVSEVMQASGQEKSDSLRATLEKEAQNREMRVLDAGYASSAATLVNNYRIELALTPADLKMTWWLTPKLPMTCYWSLFGRMMKLSHC